MDSKKATAAKFDREIAAAHPRSEWTRGYCRSRQSQRKIMYGIRPTLYTAFQNKATREVRYLYGRQLRTASLGLASTFSKI